MPGKMARSDPRPSVRVTRGDGSGQHLGSVLQEGRENANIDAGLGFIWRISDLDLLHLSWGCAFIRAVVVSQIFLSHSSTNNAQAVALRDWLKGEGWDDIFLDVDPERGIVAGERWE